MSTRLAGRFTRTTWLFWPREVAWSSRKVRPSGVISSQFTTVGCTQVPPWSSPSMMRPQGLMLVGRAPRGLPVQLPPLMRDQYSTGSPSPL